MVIRRLFSVGLLAMLVLLLAACDASGEVTTTDEEAPTTLDDGSLNVDLDDSLTGDLPPLDQTYTGENPLTGATLSVQYPAIWTAQGIDASLQLTDASVGNANSAAEGSIFVSILPVEGAQLDALGGDDPLSLLDSLTTGEIQSDLQAAESLTIAGNEAARAQGGGDTNDVLVYLVEFDEVAYVNITALTEAGAMDLYAPLIAEIVETISYTPGESE